VELSSEWQGLVFCETIWFMKKFLLIAFLSGAFAVAQVANPAQPMPSRPGAATPVGAPAQMTPVGVELNNALGQLERAAQQTSNDVGRLSIKKWKTDSAYKQSSQHDAETIQGNVNGLLAQLLSQVRSNPDSVAIVFKLYRNVDALYDVLKTLAESAGAFGPKNEFVALSSDAQNLQQARATLAAQLDALAVNKEAELSQLRTMVAQARAAAAAAPPKKIVVDDNEPPKKAVKKKKAVPKPPAAQSSAQQSQGQNAPPKQ
jgi:uncharacterized protein YbcI